MQYGVKALVGVCQGIRCKTILWMKYSRFPNNRETFAPWRGAGVFSYLWVLAFSSALQLIAVGCGSENEKPPAQSEADNYGQSGA